MRRAYKFDNDIADVAGTGQATPTAPAEGRREGAYEGAAGEEQTPGCPHPAWRRAKGCSGRAVWLREGESAASSRHL